MNATAVTAAVWLTASAAITDDQREQCWEQHLQQQQQQQRTLAADRHRGCPSIIELTNVTMSSDALLPASSFECKCPMWLCHIACCLSSATSPALWVLLQSCYKCITIVTRTCMFHRLPQVNIYCDCPLWPDDSMCQLRACSVCECAENEVPAPWLAAEKEEAATCKGAHTPDCSTNDCE
jgi:hypothetical protein